MTKLFAYERQNKILEELNVQGRITVKTLANELGVSEVTLRNDLKSMEKNQLISRTHGGAVLKQEKGIIPFSERQSRNTEEKSSIALKAYSLIKEGQCVLLDASSTALELAKLLKETKIRLTVITNGIFTALELRENPELTVMLLGGFLKKDSSALEGILGLDILTNIHVDIMFASANGFTLETGLTDFSMYEVELKLQMVKKARKLAALVDNTKIGESSIASFSNVDNIDDFITNKALPSYIENKLNQLNVRIMIAE